MRLGALLAREYRRLRWWMRLGEAACALMAAWLIVRSGTFHLFRRVVVLAPPRELPESPAILLPDAHLLAASGFPLGLQAAVWAVEWWAARVKKATCLIQALALQAMLIRRGYSSQIQIGIRDNREVPDDFHAWVEWQGRVILGEPAQPHTMVCTAEIRPGYQRCLSLLKWKPASRSLL